MKKYDLGIIGGMGPSATAELFTRIVNKTDANCDQEHLKICILNDTRIPDRTEAICNNKEKPTQYLIEDIEELIQLGCPYFAVPCNTAHYFLKEIDLTARNIKLISIIDETLSYLMQFPNKKKVILATNGTVLSNIYLQNNNDDISYLDSEKQAIIMDIITKTKSGFDFNFLTKELQKLFSTLPKDQIYVLACTELSLYKDFIPDHIVVDAMDILVEAIIKKCGYKVKK